MSFNGFYKAFNHWLKTGVHGSTRRAFAYLRGTLEVVEGRLMKPTKSLEDVTSTKRDL